MGGGSAVTHAVNRGRQPFTPDDKRCVRCRGDLQPGTDGSGNDVNTCTKCGQHHRLPSARHVPSPTAPARRATPRSTRAVEHAKEEKGEKAPLRRTAKRGAKRRATGSRARAAAEETCSIEGCNGKITPRGCMACERRKEFAVEHAKPRTCLICNAEFTVPLDSANYYIDHCDLCRPLAARAAQEASGGEDEEEDAAE